MVMVMNSWCVRHASWFRVLMPLKTRSRGSRVRRVISLSLVPLKTCRIGGGVMHVKPVEAQTSSRWCGVKAKRGWASSDVVFATWSWLKITRSVTKSPLVAE
ncbi:hypothetical protein TNCV_2095971 [Trichonephila clavipes]|nr:hypothetical protein TNCV_2095971 [Trichonephila clavipes]